MIFDYLVLFLYLRGKVYIVFTFLVSELVVIVESILTSFCCENEWSHLKPDFVSMPLNILSEFFLVPF